MLDSRSSLATTAIQADLLDRLGRDRVRVGPEAKRLCGQDVLALVLPQTTTDVQEAVQVARRRHVTLEVRQRLPVLAEDALGDAIVLAATTLNAPLELDIARRLATVGVGVTLHQLDRAARQARLCARNLPLWPGETLGSLLAEGDAGQLGLCAGALLDAVVGARVVTGTGRTLRLGGAEFLGLRAGSTRGLPSPLGLLDGHAGRGLIVCEVTLRLERAPWLLLAQGTLPAGRTALLGLLSTARMLATLGDLDTLLLTETESGTHVHLRLATMRENDLPLLEQNTLHALRETGLQLQPLVREDRRVRLGQEAPTWPDPLPPEPSLILQVPWPDLPAVLDVTDAVCHQGNVPLRRLWAVGQDALRLQLPLGELTPHPLVTHAGLLLDAGALPIAAGTRWRPLLRERMGPGAKVTLTALQRVFDPDAVISPRSGLP